jgi:hypothetical protein
MSCFSLHEIMNTVLYGYLDRMYRHDVLRIQLNRAAVLRDLPELPHLLSYPSKCVVSFLSGFVLIRVHMLLKQYVGGPFIQG